MDIYFCPISENHQGLESRFLQQFRLVYNGFYRANCDSLIQMSQTINALVNTFSNIVRKNIIVTIYL